MAGRLAKRQTSKRDALKEFAEVEPGEPTGRRPPPAKPPKERKARNVKTAAKKFVGYYLPPDLVKWVKYRAVDADAQPSHVIERILNEARAREGGRR